jgi:hypothetical protein
VLAGRPKRPNEVDKLASARECLKCQQAGGRKDRPRRFRDGAEVEIRGLTGGMSREPRQ